MFFTFSDSTCVSNAIKSYLSSGGVYSYLAFHWQLKPNTNFDCKIVKLYPISTVTIVTELKPSLVVSNHLTQRFSMLGSLQNNKTQFGDSFSEIIVLLQRFWQPNSKCSWPTRWEPLSWLAHRRHFRQQQEYLFLICYYTQAYKAKQRILISNSWFIETNLPKNYFFILCP